MFSRTIILNLIHLVNIKFWERLLELNLLHRMHASLWITLKENFSKTNKFSPAFGLDNWWYFFIWTASENELDESLNRLNSFHPNIRFIRERSREILNFLDVIVKIQQGEFVTDLYCKSTNGHQYLHFDSCQASHTKTSVVYSQALRMKRICSRRSDLIVNIIDLRIGLEKGVSQNK